jgi:hypothetical protein
MSAFKDKQTGKIFKFYFSFIFLAMVFIRLNRIGSLLFLTFEMESLLMVY